MRHTILLLAIILTFTAANMAVGADLFQQVPASDPAYKQILALNRYDHLILADQKSRLTGVPAIRLLTRYDFASLLIEPLERFCALQEGLENTTVLAPEQVRRRDLAALSVASLTPKEFLNLLDDTEKLLAAFTGEVEGLALSPGLPGRAKDALRKLRTAGSRVLPGSESSAGNKKPLSVFINPRSPVDTLTNTPIASPSSAAAERALPASPFMYDPVGEMAIRSMTTMNVAVEYLFHNYRVNVLLQTQPGENLIELIKSGGIGKAKVELWYEIGRMNDLGISAFISSQIQRSPGELGTTDVNTVNGFGVGVSW